MQKWLMNLRHLVMDLSFTSRNEIRHLLVLFFSFKLIVRLIIWKMWYRNNCASKKREMEEDLNGNGTDWIYSRAARTVQMLYTFQMTRVSCCLNCRFFVCVENLTIKLTVGYCSSGCCCWMSCDGETEIIQDLYLLSAIATLCCKQECVKLSSRCVTINILYSIDGNDRRNVYSVDDSMLPADTICTIAADTSSPFKALLLLLPVIISEHSLSSSLYVRAPGWSQNWVLKPNN